MKESYKNICINNCLSYEEQMKLVKLLDCDDINLRNIVIWKLVLTNIGLVKKAVLVFFRHSDKFEYDDLMSLGILGAINAIKKYDSSKGKLSTYIYCSVKRSIREYYKKSSIVDIELHFYSKISNYTKFVDQYYIKYGDMPSLNYIKANTGLSGTDISLIQSMCFDSVSLSDKTDDEISLMDNLPSTGSSIQEIVELRELKRILIKSLDKLSDVEVKILCCRYGLGNNEPMTQEEVAKIINCSHQNISRLERKALSKLKNSKELEKAYYA